MGKWEQEEYDRCPVCRGSLLGRVIGPRVEHQLRCERCTWKGNTDKLRRIVKQWFARAIARSEVREALAECPPTEFVGYDMLECTTKIVLALVQVKDT